MKVPELKELGFSGEGEVREFIPKLRGDKAVNTYREMADNDAIIGAILSAMTLMIRGAEWRVDPVDSDDPAREAADFVESLMDDMSNTWEDFIQEVLSMLPYGFSFFEIVLKKRVGPGEKDASRRSKYTDGRLGIRKLAIRPQTTLERFIVGKEGGIEAFRQRGQTGSSVDIPISRGLLFRTTVANNNPRGRSLLRNAYLSYYYAKTLTEIEVIAVERELAGLPLGRMPSSYMNAESGTPEAAARQKFEKILRDVKLNDQGFILIPSDVYMDDEGKPSSSPLVSFELVSSGGQRALDTGPIIRRHQTDMARTVLADFLMLGQQERGSFALSKSSTDLFLQSLESYLQSIASVLNRYLLPRIWEANGLPHELMPTLVPEAVAPVDLEELGDFINNVSGAGISLFDDLETQNVVRNHANLPSIDEDMALLGSDEDD